MTHLTRTASRRVLAIISAVVLLLALWSPSSAGHAATASASKHSSGLLAQIERAGVIKVGMAVDPPFCLQTPSGNWYSFNPTLVRLLAKQMHVRVDFVSTGWATIVAGLQADKYDIIGASISATPERKKAIDFTIPYAYGGTSWIVQRNSKLKTLKDLNNPHVTIAFSTNTFQDEITHRLMPRATMRAIPNASYADLLSELASGRSDAISVPSYLVRAIVARFHYRAIPPGDKGVDPTGVAWGVRKGNPDLLRYLNNFIRKEQRNGTIARLMKKYITVANSLKG